MTDSHWAIDIDRNMISLAEVVELPRPPLDPGQIEVKLSQFAMTANNVTYAAVGSVMGIFDNGKCYWDFFSQTDGPGRLPVWGLTEVVRSEVPTLPVGEVLYGFWSLTSHQVLTPGQINPLEFYDHSPHRIGFPAVYNNHQRVSSVVGFNAADKDWWPVFRPLYLTGWLLADQLDEESDYGAEQIIIAGASSKTAICFAHAMNLRSNKPRLIGLTSPGGKNFLSDKTWYDDLVLYDDIGSLACKPSVFVDVAGNGKVSGQVSAHLGDALQYTLGVGKTHWEAESAVRSGEASSFFAPTRVAKRLNDWGGAAGFNERMARAWAPFLVEARKHFALDHRSGVDGAISAYREAVGGHLNPRTGLLVTLD